MDHQDEMERLELQDRKVMWDSKVRMEQLDCKGLMAHQVLMVSLVSLVSPVKRVAKVHAYV